MVSADKLTDATAPEKILLSASNINFPKPNTASAVKYILEKVKENVESGCTKWVTNCVTGESVKLTELEPSSRKVASAFVKRGMQKGDVAIYMTSDVTRIYTIVIGAWRAGGVFYSSYAEDTYDTLLLRIKEAHAKWIFCDPASVPQCKEASSQVNWPVEIFVFGNVEGTTNVNQLFLDDGKDCPETVPAQGLDDPLLILCTSGTTGVSKGAVHTNKSILAFCLSAAAMPTTGKIAMVVGRSTHMTGIFFPIRNACVGSGIVLMHEISKENILKCVQEYKPAIAFGFPQYLLLLTSEGSDQYDLSSLESVCTGGMVIPDNFYTDMLTLPNVKYAINGYGLSETGTLTSTIDLGGHLSKVKTIKNQPKFSVGRLNPNTALKVIDLETGSTLGPMEKGELVVRSPTMASGYWNRPEETKKAFVNGWFRTGDLGYYDNEGFIFVVDRIKETFKYRGCHISPADLEAEILRHPAVAEVTVFGVADVNKNGEVPRALVVLKPNLIATSQEIRDLADEKLADYKKLRGGLFIVDSLPRGKTGKVLRSEAAKVTINLKC